MPGPDNGIYIVQGEVNLLVTAMRRSTRWAAHQHQDEEQDPLINSFSQLKDYLNSVAELDDLAPNEFLSPFLEVIRSEDTTGPITGLALSSVNKFLSYGLVDATCETAAAAIENIADAVTHARFVGTDPGSDEVVLMKILHVLRTLLLTPAGAQLTNESVCEIMQSCFRICFEMRLSELLRKSAEHTLMDMVQLLFSRLPQFKEDAKWASSMRKLKMRTGGMDPSRGRKKTKSSRSKQKRLQASAQMGPVPQTDQHAVAPPPEEPQNQTLSSEQTDTITASADTKLATSEPGEEDNTEQQTDSVTTDQPPEAMSPEEEILTAPEVIATTPVSYGTTVVDIQESFREACEQDEEQCQEGSEDLALEAVVVDNLSVPAPQAMRKSGSDADLSLDGEKMDATSDPGEDGESAVSATEQSDGEYVNPRGVRFMPHQNTKDGAYPLVPYGLPCVRELFRFLISLTNPLDRHNTDVMNHMGLSLLTVALESGADHIPAFSSLSGLVRDDMCKNLFFLLQSERLSLFAASIRVCFLLFEALRSHLKLQLESYISRLMDIVVCESPRVSYEQREIALESIVQLLRIPGLVTELYLNYDCDLYCSNLFEDLMKLLSKNAFPVSGLFTTHLLSLDALLAVIDSIEQHCHHRVLHSTTKLSEASQPQEQPPPRMAADSATEQDDTTTSNTVGPPAPPMSGYAMAPRMADLPPGGDLEDLGRGKKENRKGPQIRPNRMKVSSRLPTEEELIAIKNKKRVYTTGTEQFNVKPSKAIAYLQEQGLFATPLDPGEVVTFLKENPKLDKKMIGEYISSKKNSKILEAYQKSFNFQGTRVDESLRMYLETFRLPGEAPVISFLLEHFADHWHKTNGEPFANADAAFTLAYAVIILNVDQHNHNAKKQNVPMEVKDFKKNLKNVNGGQDFDQDMLTDIFEAIRSDEIIMPAEQTGLVKENYLWRVLLRRGMSSSFLHVPTGNYDRDLFAIVWGPTVAALSFVFDKSIDETIIQKAVSGFRKCAMISAHYGMSDVFDNLVISLCKFTTLLSAPESAELIPVHFGANMKAQLAAKTVFGLAHRHGDILREGWKNILDCMLQLYRAKLMPEVLIKVEDFVDPSGRISLMRDETVPQKADTGVFSSFYSYFTLTEPSPQRGTSPEEQEAVRQAHRCLQECHVEQLVTESKFLRVDSLQELLKALIFASQEEQETMNGVQCEEDAAVFYLELLIRVILQNRDRIAPFWHSIEDHLHKLIVNGKEHTFLVERAVVGLLRLAIRLLRREDIAPQVLTSLRILLVMQPSVIHGVSRQISYGLHDLLRTNAANIHSSHDWYTLFTLLEVVGAGTNPPPVMQVPDGVNVPESMVDAEVQSDSEVSNGQTCSDSGMERDYTSDSEIYTGHHHQSPRHTGSRDSGMEARPLPNTGSWLLVSREDVSNGRKMIPTNQYNIALNEELKFNDTKSLVKSCETLAFLVRDAAHVTPHNFESCVHTIRVFVEASLNGGQPAKRPVRHNRSVREKKKRQKRDSPRMIKSRSSPSHLSHMTDSDEDQETDAFHSLSIQLLDLMHTLHTRAAQIFSSWAEEEQQPAEPVAPSMPAPQAQAYLEGYESIDAGTSTLWSKCWCPLLQGIARLCCDSRRQVRSQALTYLQRALLVHDLQTLSAVEWESCFNKVLFPLLFRLLDNINNQDPNGIEETRMRASTLLCKVFLQHLTPLLSLSTFTALWLTILDFMDKYMHVDSSDLLCEAIPESLKNMLLVMHTAGILQSSEAEQTQLWKLTWDRIDTFLPKLREEVFKPHHMGMRGKGGSREASPQVSAPHTPPQQASGTESPQHRPAPSPPPSSTHQQDSPSGESSPARPESPLTATDGIPASGTYILHPPLPSVTSPGKEAAAGGGAGGGAAASPTSSPASVGGASSGQNLTTVPILLNPDIIKGSTYPIISPQVSNL